MTIRLFAQSKTRLNTESPRLANTNPPLTPWPCEGTKSKFQLQFRPNRLGFRRGGSSVGQSIGLIIRGSSVRARPAPLSLLGQIIFSSSSIAREAHYKTRRCSYSNMLTLRLADESKSMASCPANCVSQVVMRSVFRANHLPEY